MIIFFGPAGAGKSLQGQIIAHRHNWKWQSTGQIFRESGDDEILKRLASGELISDEITNEIVAHALDENSTCGEKGGLILDGYPRNLDQAQFLLDHEMARCGDYNVNLAIVIDLTKEEILARVAKRGRDEDSAEIVERRLEIYHAAIDPILDLFTKKGIDVLRIDGENTVGAVHDKIETELEARGLVK